MDIVLERILSLIPRRADGKFVHGAKKEFADSLNMAHNLVTMWEKGQSTSYRNKLHEIAMKYNVSVEWLKGETDDPTPTTGEGQKNSPAPEGTELSDVQKDAVEFVLSLPEDLLKQFIKGGKAMYGEEQ